MAAHNNDRYRQSDEERHRSAAPPVRLESALRVKTQFLSVTRPGLMPHPCCLKEVTFSHVQVREHRIIPGDNPSCQDGVPLTIDWGFDPKTQFLMEIDTFENIRGHRRSGVDLLMPRNVRETL